MPRDTSRLDQAVYAIRDLAETAEGNAEQLNTNYRIPRTSTSNFVWEDDIFDGVMEKIYIEANRAFEGDGRAARNYITRTYGQDPVIMAGLESIPSPRRLRPNTQNISEDQFDDMYTRRLERGINAPYMDYEPDPRPPRPAPRPAGMAVPDELLVNDIMAERAGLLPTSSRAARIGAMGRRAVRALPVVGAVAEAAVTANNIRNEGLSRGLQRTGAGTIDATADLAGGLGRVYWPAQLAEAGLRGLTGAYHRREEREARQELTDDELLETLLLERSR